jgi:hypothetical protein
MAYSEDLANRIRDALPDDAPVEERKMFGGLAFLLNGHMFCGIVHEALMLRLGPDGGQRALAEAAHVRPMDFTGRPMKGMVFVDPPGLHGDSLQRWIDQAAAFTRGLPPKPTG